MAGAIESFEPRAKSAGVAVKVARTPGLDVLGDPVRLEQAIGNLIANALKFTPAGGDVVIETANDDDWVEVTIRDTGQGILAETLPHVFELFHQGPSRARSTADGLGLGLAITREIVELHGGVVTATSRGSGQGSTFTIRLPRHRVTSPAMARHAGARPASVPARR